MGENNLNKFETSPIVKLTLYITADIMTTKVMTPRYLYKMGIVVTDDVIQRAADNDVLPLEGALVVRLRKPVMCVFISFGLGGISLPDTGLCMIGDGCNLSNKDEKLALATLMRMLDFENKLSLRMHWFLIDMKETESHILKSPTDEEIASLSSRYTKMKESDGVRYKMLARIARRRTTSGCNVPDGHEDDSDKDPLMVYLEDISKREEKIELARKKKLGSFPDNKIGYRMSRLFPSESIRKRGGPGADRSRGLMNASWSDLNRCRRAGMRGRPGNFSSNVGSRGGGCLSKVDASILKGGIEVDRKRNAQFSLRMMGPPPSPQKMSFVLQQVPAMRPTALQLEPENCKPTDRLTRESSDPELPSVDLKMEDDNLFGSDDDL
jgi:hypothetical protein